MLDLKARAQRWGKVCGLASALSIACETKEWKAMRDGLATDEEILELKKKLDEAFDGL